MNTEGVLFCDGKVPPQYFILKLLNICVGSDLPTFFRHNDFQAIRGVFRRGSRIILALFSHYFCSVFNVLSYRNLSF
jgi:hypothetical protein